MSRLTAGCLAAAGFFVLAPASHAAQEWGTIKGQVTWAPAALPAPVAFPAPPGTPACAKLVGGAIVTDPYVVDPKTKGIRWVVVWLLDADDPKTPIPVHPALTAVPKEKVVLDQPCCTFEPHVVCIRQGQPLIARNSAAFPHNTNVTAADWNEIIPPGTEKEVPALAAQRLPTPVACNIHPWTKAWVGVFKHPYFAVTDAEGRFEIKNAPAGKFRIVAWQETAGYLNDGAPKEKKKGQPIEIKPDGVTEVKFEFAPQPKE